jgi:endonuclease III
MPQNILHDAAALLARHYEAPLASAPAGEWSTLVRIVLEHGRPMKKSRDWSWITDSSLGTARDAADQTAPRLAEVLESTGYAGNKAGLLHRLAQWWQRRIGEADALEVFQSHSLEHWQNELKAIRGVSWELADRILLIVGGCAVYPLDRGSMRIALRHGWMDATSEYAEWQAFFARAARAATDREVGPIDLSQLWQWNVQLGRYFCGRDPDCENCPLKTLLPAGVPVRLEDEE